MEGLADTRRLIDAAATLDLPTTGLRWPHASVTVDIGVDIDVHGIEDKAIARRVAEHFGEALGWDVHDDEDNEWFIVGSFRGAHAVVYYSSPETTKASRKQCGECPKPGCRERVTT